MTKLLHLSIGLLLLFSVVLAEDDHVCDHDDQIFDSEEHDVDEDFSALDNDRFLASTTTKKYAKLRFVAHYDFLNSAPASFKRYVQEELAPPVLSYLSELLPIKYPLTGKLRSSSRTVCGKTTPTLLKNGVDADVFVIFDSRVEDSTTVASSRYCLHSSGTKRPTVVYTNFNRQMIKEAKGDVLLHEKNTYLLIHEILHTLGVSKNAYHMYIDANAKTRTGHMKTMKIAGTTHTVIDIPELTNRLRNFYGCSTVPGLIMENDGSSGTALSHLERKFFPYEVLSSGGIHGRRVSEFVVALLEGSGWYVPNYKYAEPYFFGKGQGCGFLNQKCSSTQSLFDEFCTGSSRGCAAHGRSGGRCSTNSKANGCKYINPDVDYDCDNVDAEDNARLPSLEVYGRGAESKCFAGTLSTRKSTGTTSSTSFCFKYNCVGSGSNLQLEVLLGSKKVICEAAGNKTVTGYYGYIKCPDPKKFCEGQGRKYCPRGCMGRGTCVNNKCQCNKGFTGVDCGLKA